MDCVSVSSYQWVIWIIWMPITQLSPLSPKQSYTAERKSSLQYKVIVHNSIWKNLFPWKLQQIQRAQEHYLIEQILSYKMPFFNTVTIMNCAFLPVVNKSLHAVFITICTTGSDPLLLSPLLKHTSHGLLWSHPQVGLHRHSQVLLNVNECHFFNMEELSDTPLLQTHFHVMSLCQTASLLPSVTQQQNVMGYWWEGSTSTAKLPTTSNMVGWHHKIGSITFRVAFIKYVI